MPPQRDSNHTAYYCLLIGVLLHSYAVVVSEDGVDELASVLNDAADQWFNFTGLLGIPFDVRERIRLDHSSDPQLCLKMALRIWIQDDPNPTTCDRLSNVLMKEAESKDLLAAKVQQVASSKVLGKDMSTTNM